MRKIKLLSVIIPAYNEEKRLSNTVKRIITFLKLKNINFEIIIINDGSTDNTRELVIKLKKEFRQVRLFDNPKNLGKGFSVKTGVLNSKGDTILLSDADLSTPIQEYIKLFYWYNKGHDICIGSRRMKSSKIRVKQPLHRIILGMAFGKVVQILALGNIKDTQCGFKLFNAKIAKDIFSRQKINGFSYDVETLFLARKENVKIKEVPVIWVNSPKHSKVNIAKETIKMFYDVLRIKVMHR